MTKKTIMKKSDPETSDHQTRTGVEVEELRWRWKRPSRRYARPRAGRLAGAVSNREPNPWCECRRTGLFSTAIRRRPGCPVGVRGRPTFCRIAAEASRVAMARSQEVEQNVQLAERFYVVSAMPFQGVR